MGSLPWSFLINEACVVIVFNVVPGFALRNRQMCLSILYTVDVLLTDVMFADASTHSANEFTAQLRNMSGCRPSVSTSIHKLWVENLCSKGGYVIEGDYQLVRQGVLGWATKHFVHGPVKQGAAAQN